MSGFTTLVSPFGSLGSGEGWGLEGKGLADQGASSVRLIGAASQSASLGPDGLGS